MGDLTRVTIDFKTSHLIFPGLVAAILGALALAIVIRERHAIAGAAGYWSGILAQMDRLRFFGTVVLTVLYFSLMVPVGNLWPNTGMGFLLCSVPYVLLTGLLFLHERGLRHVLPVIVTAAVAPTVVWGRFTYPFFLPLP